MKAFETGGWIGGVNSFVSPDSIPDSQYQWSINTLNRGGVVTTRPGMKSIQITPLSAGGSTPINPNARTPFSRPQAITAFTSKQGDQYLVVVSSGAVFYQKYPFEDFGWTQMSEISFDRDAVVNMETAVVAVSEDASGNLISVDPYPVLMISDNSTRTAFWDGVTARHLDPTADETPVCKWMKWIGNRLWVASGRKIRVSNLLNPLLFTEEDILSEGGYFNLPADCTGFGTTPDFKSLLAFTNSTTTSFSAGILDRSTWQKTTDFQNVLFSNIGCVAGKTIVNQYGMTWWMSQGGLVAIDNALQAYRSSRIHYRDQNMIRSRVNLSDDTSLSCAGVFGNFLMMSVPSGDIYNAHTMVMDEGIVDTLDQIAPPEWASIWTGIRPVQWVTMMINGRPRCFCLSSNLVPAGLEEHDLTPEVSTYLPEVPNSFHCVWEIFTSSQTDIGFDYLGNKYDSNIECLLETKYLGTGGYYKFHYAELELEGISGSVDINVAFCGKRGAYNEILSGTINSTIGSLSDPFGSDPATPDITPEYVLPKFLKQRRTLKTPSSGLPMCSAAEGRWNRERSFSLLIRWTGVMGVSRCKVVLNEETENIEGECAADETYDRYIQPTGESVVTEVPSTSVSLDKTFIVPALPMPYSQRWQEETYSPIL